MKLIFKSIQVNPRCQSCALAGGVLGSRGGRSIICDVDNRLHNKNDRCKHFTSVPAKHRKLE